MFIDNIQEIMTIIDKNKHILSDGDYLSICHNLEEIYKDCDKNDYDFDNDYVHQYNNIQFHKNLKFKLSITMLIMILCHIVIKSYK